MSNRKLKLASYSIKKLLDDNKLGSYKTQSDTKTMLLRTVKDLHQLGFKVSTVYAIKEKHVTALVEHWKKTHNNPATIKNYMAKLRGACEMMGKEKIIHPSNAHYGIEKRQYMSDKNASITNIDLKKLKDPYIQLSVQAQMLFGLRREESLKLVASQAYKENWLMIKSSWTKGGIARQIPIKTQEQHDLLNKIIQTVGKGKSLIPEGTTNKQQINKYNKTVYKAGYKKLHGLRHAYAQKRYHDLTHELSNGKGWNCPKEGGRPSKTMSDFEKTIDQQARSVISQELGHSRVAITKIYVG